MGLKGCGKTKRMIEWVNAAVDNDPGLVVLIENGKKLTFDIHHGARLVDASDYRIKGTEALCGFLAGLHAGNYDISHIFIDSLYKITGVSSMAETEKLLAWLSAFADNHSVDFTVTISDDENMASENIKKYFPAAG